MTRETLYQVLGISTAASADEIEAGYRRALAALAASESRMNREDYDFRHTLIVLARDTLSDPVSRMGYDEKLARQLNADSSGHSAGRPRGRSPAPASARLPAPGKTGGPGASMRNTGAAYDADAASGGQGGFRASSLHLSGSHSSPFRSLLAIIVTIVILVVVFQLYSIYASRVERTRNAKLAAAATLAEEHLVIQDYFYRYGERPASAEEARRLDSEKRRREFETLQAQRRQQLEERAAQQQQEADRRYADRVSFDLRRAEEAKRREAEQEEKRAQEEAERKQREEKLRTERMQQRWRSAIQQN